MAGVVDLLVRCEGGGPAGVVDGIERRERPPRVFGVLGKSEDSGSRKDIASALYDVYP